MEMLFFSFKVEQITNFKGFTLREMNRTDIKNEQRHANSTPKSGGFPYKRD